MRETSKVLMIKGSISSFWWYSLRKLTATVSAGLVSVSILLPLWVKWYQYMRAGPKTLINLKAIAN